MSTMKAKMMMAAAALMVTLAACGGSGPDPAACKAAMKTQIAAALATGAQGSEPAACHGLSGAELEKIASEVLNGS
jgi:predicted small lipoprotein YifL